MKFMDQTESGDFAADQTESGDFAADQTGSGDFAACDGVSTNLVFNISDPLDSSPAVWESMFDMLNATFNPPKLDSPHKVFIRVTSKHTISNLGRMIGPCEHHRCIRECWICNPCKICPSMPWNELLRPHPRTKQHVVSNIHIESLKKRKREGKNVIGDDDYIPDVRVLPPRSKRQIGTRCSHNKRPRQCGKCNPCYICSDPAIGRVLANTTDHQRSYSHRSRIAWGMGRFI